MRFFIVFGVILASLLVLVDAGRHGVSRAEKTLMEKRGQFSGVGTFFNPSTEGGSMGACGKFESDDAQIVALNAPQYGSLSSKSSWCGKKVKICYKKKCTTAVVNDACPECKYGSLDLTHTVFKDLEKNMDVGVIDITWSEA
ncbi:unnamed protein product [Cunninghamella blakesleeana]